MPSPTFLIPGASRSGTTTLWSIIKQHPSICLPKKKELRFFEKDKKYERGMDKYEKHFEYCKKNNEIGEASTTYFEKGIRKDKDNSYIYDVDDDPAIRIKKNYPNIKLVISLRNPIDRIYSQFYKNRKMGIEKEEDVMRAIKKEVGGKRSYKRDKCCWLYRNSYSLHIEKWLELFSRSQIKIIIFEEWINEKEKTANDLFEFLGVDRNVGINVNKKKNVGKSVMSDRLAVLRRKYLSDTLLGELVSTINRSRGRPEPSKCEREWLFELLKDDINNLEHILDRSLKVWYL